MVGICILIVALVAVLAINIHQSVQLLKLKADYRLLRDRVGHLEGREISLAFTCVFEISHSYADRKSASAVSVVTAS